MASLAALAGGAAIQGGLGYLAARKQSQTAKKGIKAQQKLAKEQMGRSRKMAAAGSSILSRGGQAAREGLAAGALAAEDPLQRAAVQQLGYLGQGFDQAGQALQPALGLQSLAPQAAQRISTFDVAGQAPGRAGAMLDRGLFSNFEADPGYQFRVQEGERALAARRSAMGGRSGGAALKELERFRQGLASQEFQNFAARRQAELSGAQSADALGLQALSTQAGLEQSAGLNQRAAQLALAQQGFGAGRQLAGLAAGLGQQQAGVAGATGSALSNLRYGAAQNIAQLHQAENIARAQTLLAGAGQQTQLTGAALPGLQGATPYAGGGLAALANTAGALGVAGAQYFASQPAAPQSQLTALDPRGRQTNVTIME